MVYLGEKGENGDPRVTSDNRDIDRGHVQTFGISHKLVGPHHIQCRDTKHTRRGIKEQSLDTGTQARYTGATQWNLVNMNTVKAKL